MKIGNNLLESLIKDKKKIENFADVLNLSNNVDRHLDVGYIDQETGDIVEDIIRFWNRVDDELEMRCRVESIPSGVEPLPFKREPIKIYINSEGGSLLATLTMIDAIRMSKTPVYTINTGMAYSGGFFTFIAGHKRFAYPRSSFLFHEGNMQLGNLDAHKFRNAADFYNKQLEILKNDVLNFTKISKEDYEAHQKDDWWFMADEALEKRICDEIITEFI